MSLSIIYAKEPLPKEIVKSIFLAGPTPRSTDVPSWRPEAIQILESIGYDGTVFVPEPRSGEYGGEYVDQVEWEEAALNMADCILFWIPRDLVTMPAFTTNVEFGFWHDSGKVVFGAPLDAPKNKYLFHYTEKENIPKSLTLEDAIKSAISILGDGSLREDGECYIPLNIWKTKAFQSWYKYLKRAGNSLVKAEAVWQSKIHATDKNLFSWILRVDVYITNENRIKSNEFIVARPDISTVVMYKKSDDFLDTEIVLVKEFRSAVSNDVGMVFEAPGGSNMDTGLSWEDIAIEECKEEVGLDIEASRLKYIDTRQLASTMLTHKAHVYALELTEAEMSKVKSSQGSHAGVPEDSEVTYPVTATLKEILEGTVEVDWSMAGIITSAILKK